MKGTIWLCLSLFGHMLGAQDLKEDLAKINKNYGGGIAFQQEIHFQLFSAFEGGEEIESYTTFVQKQGNASYSRRKEIESLRNEEVSVLINHASKAILIQDSPQSSSEIMENIDLDSWLEKCEKTEFQKLSAKTAQYVFHFQDYRYGKIKLAFDPSSFLLKKISLYAREDETPMRAEISFQKVKTLKSFPPKTFSEHKYVTQKEGKYVPTASYANYQLLNYLSKR